MRPSAQPFLWKWVLFAWEWKIISISKAEHLTSFWNRGPVEYGNGLLIDIRTYYIFSCPFNNILPTFIADRTISRAWLWMGWESCSSVQTRNSLPSLPPDLAKFPVICKFRIFFFTCAQTRTYVPLLTRQCNRKSSLPTQAAICVVSSSCISATYPDRSIIIPWRVIMRVIMAMDSILYNLKNSSSDVNLQLSELEYSQWSLKRRIQVLDVYVCIIHIIHSNNNNANKKNIQESVKKIKKLNQ